MQSETNRFDILKKEAQFWRRPTLPGPKTQVPSAKSDLTAEFGMGSGITHSLLTPKLNLFVLLAEQKAVSGMKPMIQPPSQIVESSTEAESRNRV